VGCYLLGGAAALLLVEMMGEPIPQEERRARNRRMAERVLAGELTYEQAAVEYDRGVHYVMRIVATYRRAKEAERKQRNAKKRKEYKREEGIQT